MPILTLPGTTPPTNNLHIILCGWHKSAMFIFIACDLVFDVDWIVISFTSGCFVHSLQG